MTKLAVITLFLDHHRNRFMQYQTPRTVAERLDMAGGVEGLEGVELRYPVDFDDIAALKQGLERNNLGVAAINFASVRGDRWMRGAWTSESPAERQDAVDDFKRAIDVAADLGAPRLTNCPLNDGFDYNFELDFIKAYDRAIQCYAAVAAHNPDMRICIEYKISEPRVRSLLGSAGETAAFCQMVGADNLGVTLDVGHALLAYENAAQSAALLARANRLFYVHVNDNDGRGDWDLLPGSVHMWELVEFFYYLRLIGYDDWLTFDVVPKEEDPKEVFATAVRMTRKLEEIAERVDRQKMESLFADRKPGQTLDYLFSLI